MLFQKAVHVGEILRNKGTRDMWLVVHKTTQGVFIVNLMLHNRDASDVHIILSSHTGRWDRDNEIDDLSEWEKRQIEDSLPVIEEIEKQALEENTQEDIEVQENLFSQEKTEGAV